MVIRLIPQAEFRRVAASISNPCNRLALVADMCRANTLAAVKRAGSGHLGSSFSAMDIVVWLYYQRMNVISLGITHPDRDIYFSSKGHDVPGLYAVLHSLGVLSGEKLMRLRRYGGLDGHPDVGVPGIEANSGSLGMGISKGRGLAWAKRRAGRGGHVYVMTGDGELQEGQNYEALLNSVNHRASGLTVLVDHNKVQSDRLVSEIADVGDLEAKFRAFGWHVARCNGHDFEAFDEAFAALDPGADRPTVLILDTIKGRGVSFMEHPAALAVCDGLYPWHAGAPDDQSFLAGYEELIGRINDRLARHGLGPVVAEDVPPEPVTRVQRDGSAATAPAISLDGEPASIAAPAASEVSSEFVSKAYGRALVELAATRSDLVVLDADLSADCKIREFELSFPDQFIENGIAEQDMVSMAGGLARQGLLPVVNSFASFLAARANEQIYNNATERSKVIYACHYAGLIPAGPGKSHQSVRDISLLAGLPNMIIVQPCNAVETGQVVEYCVREATESCAIRLAIGPSPRVIPLPSDYRLRVGRGVSITEGADAVLFAYGPVMLHEALVAVEHLSARGFGLRVVNMPWLNRLDTDWLVDAVAAYPAIYVVEDHGPVGALGDCMLNSLMAARALAGRQVIKFAVEGYPACGTPPEALSVHGLDGASLARRILRHRGERPT
ncbi:MAG TPA: transketolase C-terminal domain-containing protein [Vicinamibacterales bacterium]|nr:transketolase C-terminal domain-containing protein [Vicinamibacterales bacterium]